MLSAIKEKSVLFGAAALLLAGFAGGAQAQVAADNEAKVLERLPADTCQKERIKASANGGVGVVRDKDGPARDRAISRWRSDTTSKYGGKFGEWENALLPNVQCFSTGFALTRKCEVSAFPCSRKISEAELKSIGISDIETTEILEMQRLMNALLKTKAAKASLKKKEKLPKALKADGGFGADSVKVMTFLVDHGLVADTGDLQPTKANLEALRKAANETK